MFVKRVQQSGFAILTAVTLSLGGAALTNSAQAAPLHVKQIQISETGINKNLIQVRGFGKHRGHGFKGHSRSYKRGHKFSRGHGFRSNRYSRHGHFANKNGSRRIDFTKRQIPGFVLTPKSR